MNNNIPPTIVCILYKSNDVLGNNNLLFIWEKRNNDAIDIESNIVNIATMKKVPIISNNAFTQKTLIYSSHYNIKKYVDANKHSWFTNKQ